MGQYRIGEAAAQLGLSADTLRYYERIGLLPKVGRNGGARRYTDQDLSRLHFVRRAQTMNFTLAEIADLLRMREQPQRARKEVRTLTANKLAEVEQRLKDLGHLRRELRLLVNLCTGAGKACPIIDKIDRS
jgi:DNA-binding transcriptional MerR regulator